MACRGDDLDVPVRVVAVVRDQPLEQVEAAPQFVLDVLEAEEDDPPLPRRLSPDAGEVPPDPDAEGGRQHDEALTRAAGADDVADGAEHEAG